MRIKDSISIYNASVNSYLNYGVLAWGGLFRIHPSLFDIIISLQKKCIGNACHVKYNAHTSPLCFKLKILKFEEVYNVQIASHYYDCFHKLLPENLSSDLFFPLNQYIHLHTTRQSKLIHFQNTCRLDIALANYRFVLPTIANSLPPSLRHDLTNLSLKNVQLKYIKNFILSSRPTGISFVLILIAFLAHMS